MFSFSKKMILAAAVAVGMTAPAAAQQDTVRLGWTAWSDAEFVTKLAAKILEDRMGQDVELIQTDIAPQYQGVAKGDIDAMLMSWQPGTHADYLEKLGPDMVNLSLLYGNASLGWVVPNYIPEDQLSSIEDLTKDEVREKLDGKIQGIDPGAGLMRLSGETIEEYGLDYDLVSASGAAMTAALDRAIKRDEWIVVTGWRPHWMFGKYDLRYLEDPKGTLGAAERVHAVARKGFYQENTEAAMMLARYWLPLEELETAMAEAQDTSYEEAVDNYIQNHPNRVEYWVSGKIAE